MKKLIFSGLGILIALFIIEIGLRLFIRQTTLKFYDNDIFGSAFVPNQKGWFVSNTKEYSTWVEINPQGWPDVNHSIDKPENVFRILILGDSFVENLQVPIEERFFRKLQTNFDEKIKDKKIEIIAIGRGNTGTAQEFLILKNYGLIYQPDLIIQMFLTANDVKNNSPLLQNDPYLPYFILDQGNNLVEIPPAKRNQKILSRLKGALKQLRVVELALSARQKILEAKASRAMGGYPVDYHIYDQSYDINYTNAWNITKKLILEAKKATENSEARYILVTLANNEQVNQKVREKIFKTYPEAKKANLDFEKPDKIIKGFCDQEKITYWQMLPYFLDSENKNPDTLTHFFYDGHWNERGTNLAADFLFKNLENYLIIK